MYQRCLHPRDRRMHVPADRGLLSRRARLRRRRRMHQRHVRCEPHVSAWRGLLRRRRGLHDRRVRSCRRMRAHGRPELRIVQDGGRLPGGRRSVHGEGVCRRAMRASVFGDRLRRRRPVHHRRLCQRRRLHAHPDRVLLRDCERVRGSQRLYGRRLRLRREPLRPLDRRRHVYPVYGRRSVRMRTTMHDQVQRRPVRGRRRRLRRRRSLHGGFMRSWHGLRTRPARRRGRRL